MKVIKLFDMLAIILFFFISFFVFSFQPFVSSLFIPSIVRESLILLLAFFFISVSIKKKLTFYFSILFPPIALILFFIWRQSSPDSTPFIAYFFSFLFFTVGLFASFKKLPQLAYILSKAFLGLVIGISILSIFSFISFNFNLIPYYPLRLGDFDYYNYYHNFFLGYIDPKHFGDVLIGRVAGFMFEPSYLAWFLTTNFFLIPKYIRVAGMPVILCKMVVLLGALTTFSTSAWITFGVIFLFKAISFTLRKIRLSDRLIKTVISVLLIIFILGIFLTPMEKIGQLLGNSSFADREARTQASLMIVVTSDVKGLILGHSPGYVENTLIKGASNQYMKLFVEEGLLIFILVIGLIIYCTRRSRDFMIANLIFLNGVVVLWTPLFLINVLICKWLDDKYCKIY